MGSESTTQATANYARYCCKEGAPEFIYNPAQAWNINEQQETETDNNSEIELPITQPNKKTKTCEIIRDRILQRASPNALMLEFPGCIPLIKQLCQLRPRLYESTKTVNLKRVLNYFRELWDITYYFKMGGLSKFFNGYNFDDIVIIDDPVEPSIATGDDIAMFKIIINDHERQVEIKGSSMPWDTKLVIITSNISAKTMANACGETCADAIYRRLTKPFAQCLVRENEYDKYTIFLIKIVSKVFNIHIDPNYVMTQLEPVPEPLSDVEY